MQCHVTCQVSLTGEGEGVGIFCINRESVRDAEMAKDGCGVTPT